MRRPKPPAVPEFGSDRMLLLGPLLTPRVIELARLRIGARQKFFRGPALVVDDSRDTVRLALIIAHMMSPFEDFQDEEEALLRGCDADTLRKRKKDGLVNPLA